MNVDLSKPLSTEDVRVARRALATLFDLVPRERDTRMPARDAQVDLDRVIEKIARLVAGTAPTAPAPANDAGTSGVGAGAGGEGAPAVIATPTDAADTRAMAALRRMAFALLDSMTDEERKDLMADFCPECGQTYPEDPDAEHDCPEGGEDEEESEA